MASITRLRPLTCVLAILVAGVSGCRDSASVGPTTDDSPDATTASQSSQNETASVGPPAAETADPGLFGIGSPAPALSVAKWVHGQPIDGFEPGKVYVVEFWATWCGPCLASMPHLSQLQREYGDAVTFVGVTDESEATVTEFLGEEQSPDKTWAEVLQYRLAIDAGDATNEAYMVAAEQSGIPTAFIIGRDTAVEWIGHPMTMGEPLAKIVAGDWDRQAAVVQFERQRKLERLTPELIAKLRAEEWDDALSMLDQAEQELGKSAQLSLMRLSVLLAAGRTEKVAEAQGEAVEQAWDSADVLNEIAWGIATGEMKGDMDLALKAAQRASELREHKDGAILDTLARVYYEKGELDKAVEWQTKAVELSQGDAFIEATLKKYEAEKAHQSGDSEAPTEDSPASGDES